VFLRDVYKEERERERRGGGRGTERGKEHPSSECS